LTSPLRCCFFARKACAALLFAAWGGAAVAQAVSPADYRAARSRIDAEYKADVRACKAYTEQAREVCETAARGKQKVARAELDFNRSGSEADARKLAAVKAEVAYEIAEERCDLRQGKDRETCLQHAKAADAKAKAEAKEAEAARAGKS
jgi:hypothetical protein